MSQELAPKEASVSESSELERYPWLKRIGATAASILLPILATIAFAWYQSSEAEEEGRKAELEREKAVKKQLVSIVEEHVLNGEPLDLSRLRRITDLQVKEQEIRSSLPILELVEKAELNILDSRYLDFDSKKTYKKVFDNIYKEIGQSTKMDYDGRHLGLVDDLVANLKKGKSEDAVHKLNRLLEAFNADIGELESRSSPDSKSFIFGEVIASPFFLALMVAYSALVFYFWSRVQARRRARERALEELLKDYEIRKDT